MIQADMVLDQLDSYLRDTLSFDETDRIDASLNGLQVSRRGEEVRRVACAVDACMETFRRAVDAGADLLFVHHGLFWGNSAPMVRSHFERIRFLIENNLALYAVHLPLDIHPTLGNNAAIAAKLGLSDSEAFGVYKGTRIGRKGVLPAAATVEEIMDTLSFDPQACTSVLKFGPERIRSVGIVSGGGTHEISQAVAERLDLYITGDASHTMYHYCLEESINLLCAGHYQTETFGVREIAALLEREAGLETVFIDVPTGL